MNSDQLVDDACFQLRTEPHALSSALAALLTEVKVLRRHARVLEALRDKIEYTPLARELAWDQIEDRVVVGEIALAGGVRRLLFNDGTHVDWPAPVNDGNDGSGEGF